MELAQWLRRIFKFRQFIFVISLLFPPWKRVLPLICTKLNPDHQGCFKSSLVEIGRMVMEEKIKFYELRHRISLFRYYLPLEKGVPFTPKCFVLSLAEIGSVDLE